MIFKAVPQLKTQKFKLHKVLVRLRERDSRLFKTCSTALKNNNKKRATIFANELAEVRKLTKIISQTQILVERLILRLETLKELNAAFGELRPVLEILHNVTRRLTTIMPQMAFEMGRVNDSISETLAMTSMKSIHLDIPVGLKTPGGEEVLKEVSEHLEQKIADKLPEPPATMQVPEARREHVEQVKEMVALAATCSELSEKPKSKTLVSYKDMELHSFSLRVRESPSPNESSPSLDEMLLDYVKKCQGNIDVTRCALELRIQPNEVKNTLERLGAQGKIRLAR